MKLSNYLPYFISHSFTWLKRRPFGPSSRCLLSRQSHSPISFAATYLILTWISRNTGSYRDNMNSTRCHGQACVSGAMRFLCTEMLQVYCECVMGVIIHLLILVNSTASKRVPAGDYNTCCKMSSSYWPSYFTEQQYQWDKRSMHFPLHMLLTHWAPPAVLGQMVLLFICCESKWRICPRFSFLSWKIFLFLTEDGIGLNSIGRSSVSITYCHSLSGKTYGWL